MRRLLVISLIFSIALADQIRVVDEKTGEALPGVNITVVGTTHGMNTDVEGYFTLYDMYRENALKLSYIGYLDTTLNYEDLEGVSEIAMRPDVLLMEKVEVLSSKLEWEQSDLPSIVTVLPVQDIIQQGSMEIKEVLRRDPSVVVDEGYDGKHEISIRGSNANEVLIVFDDIPLNSSYLGGYDLSWINLNDIESVSIIKGAGTMQYGSGAFGGVVVLNPVKRTPTGLSVNYQRTDQELESYNTSGGLDLGPVNARLSYSSMERMPFGPGAPEMVFNRDFINFYSTLMMKDTSNYFSANVINIQENVQPEEGFEDSRADNYVQLKYSGHITEKMQLNLRAMQRDRSSFYLNKLDTRFNYTEDSNEGKQIFAIENRAVLNSVVNYMIVDMHRDEFHGVSETRNIYWDHLDEQDIKLNQERISLTDIVKFRTDVGIPLVDYIGINLSYRLEEVSLVKLRTKTRDGSQYVDEELEDQHRQITKRTGVTLDKKRKNLRYQLFYTSGTNLRLPTLYEFYLRDHTTIVAHQQSPLESELNSSSEFGVQASIQSKNPQALIEAFDLQASIYKNSYLNKIYYISIPRALPTPVNAKSAEITGYELSGMASMLNDHIRLYAGRTKVNISSFTVFPNKPEFRDVAEFELRHDYASLRLQYFHEGSGLFGGTSDNINWVVFESPGRENVNLYSSLKLKPLGQDFHMGFTILNLLSDQDETNYFKQRRWSTSIGFKF